MEKNSMEKVYLLFLLEIIKFWRIEYWEGCLLRNKEV